MVSAPEKTAIMPANFLTSVKVEPVGRWFLSHWDRLHSHRHLSTISGQEEESSSESEEETQEVEFEDDIEYLRSLDPKETKDQDHYRVLGIAKLRIKATDEQIKKAHRFKVLRHHPDKRRALGEEIREDDDYFSCITKALEILGNPIKRRAFDSVDPTVDDEVPEVKKNASKDDFFALFGAAFENNARWSTRKPIPKLGDMEMARDKVDKFYKFWYDFDSWREFSYLDEEDKEKGSDRDERRWIEKNNKVERAERKKEEMKRIRKLVDNAYNNDPRIAKFREDDKNEKLAKKKAKQDAAKARRDEEERVKREEEERIKAEKEKKEAEDKAKQEALKKEKEANKKAIKKERKALRTLCKDNDFYAKDDSEKLTHMTEVDKLCEALTIAELADFNKRLAVEGREALVSFIDSTNKRLQTEQMDQLKAGKSGGGVEKGTGGPAWSSDELNLLIKAVNLFPAGTNQRWEVVASFINQHTKTPSIQRKAKETLSKAKEMQQGDYHTNALKEEANKNAYENLEKQKKRDVQVESEASTRTETAAEVQGLNVSPWSPDEQKLLEQALKTFPSSLGTARWDKIAESIPNRSRKDCMKRYKELAEIVRAKKAAQAAASAK